MTSNYEISYISGGCNRTPHSVDWGRNGLICFGCCNSVAIYDPNISGEGGKIIHTLHCHKGRVNCVRWLRNNLIEPEQQFISASADETAILWSWCDKTHSYEPETVLKGHKNIVSVADGLIRRQSSRYHSNKEDSILLGTCSIDSTVMVWEHCGQEELKCIDVINWSSGFCLDIKFTILPNTDIALLACAADDNKVHLYAEQKSSELEKSDLQHKFTKVHILVGHDDWVRAMDFVCDENNSLFLATGSQDTHIRVYKFQRKTDQKANYPKSSKSINQKEILETEEKIIKIGSDSEHQFAVTLETILAGHEGWVYGVCWYLPLCDSRKENLEITGFKPQNIKLLSSSMDKSLIVWSSAKIGVWTEEARVGEVGGNMLGFYGGKFGQNGMSILGHGYQGSFHIWSFDKQNKNWEPKVVIGGHSADVMDLTWDINGDYILSVGSDQTTRLHAPWIRNNNQMLTWHEIARPQIHGYDMNCIAMLSECKFASGAEEKVIRAFTAPNNFVENFRRISKININFDDIKVEGLPQGASVPALGLTNKPVFEQMKKEGFIVDDEYPDLYFSPIHLESELCLDYAMKASCSDFDPANLLIDASYHFNYFVNYFTEPPTEENLMQNTLWPEAQKLYGHGFEVYSLAARNDGVVLASSCKAASYEHAVIILWNAKTWLQFQKLFSHQLTVTQMSFSPDGKYLLSVSRDRRWSLFGVNEDGKTYQQLTASDAKDGLHTRVIWCCCWTFDSSIFATGSRDGKIGFWSPVSSEDGVTVKLLTHLDFPKESVTALAFAPVLTCAFHILAVGLEKGNIFLYKYLDSVAQRMWVLEDNTGHDLTVKRLAFRPKVGRAGINEEQKKESSKTLQLASCGCDHFLKIYDLFLNNL